jgi:hypothetical protein
VRDAGWRNGNSQPKWRALAPKSPEGCGVQHGLSPNRIVIVGSRRYENSPYANRDELAGIRLVDEASGENDHDGIRYATIYRFKGLEADCAILSGFSRPAPEQSNCELYCAASRAKLMLHILYRKATTGHSH